MEPTEPPMVEVGQAARDLTPVLAIASTHGRAPSGSCSHEWVPSLG